MLLKFCFSFFLIVFHKQGIENVVPSWVYRHLQNFAAVLALTEMVDRGDGRDRAINWPVVCPPNCHPFCLGISRRQSLTSIPITVLLFIFYNQQTLGNASRAYD